MFLSTQWNFKGGFWGNGKQNLAILGGVPSSSTRFSSLRLVLDHGTRLFFKVFGIRFRGSSCEPLSKREFIKIRVEFYLLCVMCPVYLTVNSHRKYCNYFRKHKICPGKNSQKVTCYQPYLHSSRKMICKQFKHLWKRKLNRPVLSNLIWEDKMHFFLFSFCI